MTSTNNSAYAGSRVSRNTGSSASDLTKRVESSRGARRVASSQRPLSARSVGVGVGRSFDERISSTNRRKTKRSAVPIDERADSASEAQTIRNRQTSNTARRSDYSVRNRGNSIHKINNDVSDSHRTGIESHCGSRRGRSATANDPSGESSSIIENVTVPSKTRSVEIGRTSSELSVGERLRSTQNISTSGKSQSRDSSTRSLNHAPSTIVDSKVVSRDSRNANKRESTCGSGSLESSRAEGNARGDSSTQIKSRHSLIRHGSGEALEESSRDATNGGSNVGEGRALEGD